MFGRLFPYVFLILFIKTIKSNGVNKINGLNRTALTTGSPTPKIDPNTVTLYGMRFCPWTERVLLCAARKGIKLNYISIDLKEVPEWYLLKNPNAQVPTIEFKNETLWESSILAEFLDDYFQENPTLSVDPIDRAKEKILANDLKEILPKAYSKILNSIDNETVLEESRSEMMESLLEAEKLLKKKGTFYHGEKPGFADYLTIPFLERIFVLSHRNDLTGLNVEDFPGNKHFPYLTRWFWRMTQLPEYEVTQPVDTQLEWFDSQIKGEPNYNAGLHHNHIN